MPISELIKSKKVAIAEITPPEHNGLHAKIKHVLDNLVGIGLDGLDITSSSLGRNRLGYFDIMPLVRENFRDIPVVAHLSSRDTTERNFDEQMSKAFQNGISDILVIRGDPYKENGLNSYAFGKADIVSKISNFPLYSPGILMAVSGDFKDINKNHMELLKRAQDYGADAFMTKVITDYESAARYLDSITKNGISVPVIGQVMFLDSIGKIKFIEENKIGHAVPRDYKCLIARLTEEERKSSARGYSARLANNLQMEGYSGIAFNIIYHKSDPAHLRAVLPQIIRGVDFKPEEFSQTARD